MKLFKRWITRLLLTLTAGMFLLIITLLNPTLLYSYETEVDQVTVLHDAPLAEGFEEVVRQAIETVRTSELYDPAFEVQLCLNEGSFYPEIMKSIRGAGFGYGYYTIALIRAEVDVATMTAEINGYYWNLKQLIAHEIIHTLQYHRYGFKTLNHAGWKAEGYPEYIARQSTLSLKGEVARLISFGGDAQIKEWVWVKDKEGTGVSLDYYQNHLLVRFMMEQKKLSYDDLLFNESDKTEVLNEMLNWYQNSSQVSE